MKDEKTQKQSAAELAELVRSTLDNKKGMDVTVLEVGEQTIVADYFVLATGTSNTHVAALADETEFQVRESLDITPRHIEGAEGNAWILMDYGSVVVHIFTKTGRDFYRLERLWSGAERIISSEGDE